MTSDETVERVRVLTLQPGDMLVLECQYPMTKDVLDRLKTALEAVTKVPVLVLQPGVSLKVARPPSGS